MKEYVYLVGQISVDVPKTYQWREYVRAQFDDTDDIIIIDPCNNKFNQAMLKKYAHLDKDRLQVYGEQGIDILVSKDYSFVERSTIAIADLNIYDPQKAIIGSYFELAWYYMHPDKTVVGVYAGDREKNGLHTRHPFVNQAVTTWVKTHEEAWELIRYYFIDEY